MVVERKEEASFCIKWPNEKNLYKKMMTSKQNLNLRSTELLKKKVII